MIGYPTSAAAARLRHEIRRCGPGIWLLPAAGAVAGAAAGFSPATAHSVLLPASGTALAGLAALCVVAMLGRERMLELHSALPGPVPLLMARRLAVMALFAAAAGACTGAAAFAAAAGEPGAAVSAASAPGALAVAAAGSVASATGAVLSAAALLAGTAVLTWARSRSAAAASGALVGVWLAHGLLWAPNVPPELDAPVCAAAGAALVWRGLHSLAGPERILAKEAR